MQFFFYILILVSTKSAFALSKLDQQTISKYLELQNEFQELTCKRNTAEEYAKLNNIYRGDGNYIPETVDHKIDKKTIAAHLPLLKEKILWIDKQIAVLQNLKNFNSINMVLKRIENEVNVLQEAKRDHFFSYSKRAKEKIEERSRRQYKQLLKEVESFRSIASFMLSFKFPLDHLNLRANYDHNKTLKGKTGRQKTNSVYFFRKIVQDGAYDENLYRNDSIVRAAFDTLYLSIYKDDNRYFLTENERADFKYVIEQYRKLFELKGKKIKLRMHAWKKRTADSYDFYKNLLEGKKITLEEMSDEQNLILARRSQALLNLKKFVLKKEAESYLYWSKKSELFQALYSLETILYAEVGRLDSDDLLEKKDVAQVVINRSENPLFNQLSSEDSIEAFLPKEIKTKEHKWLNVLFKEGEFSFTYFYIPGNLQIYCPDMTKIGHFMRKENLRVALELLTNPRKDFTAIRYFSRMSMFGRIEMDSLWAQFSPIGEFPGSPVKTPKKIAKLIKQDRYKFYYHFEVIEKAEKAQKTKTFMVLEISDKVYVVDRDFPSQIFNYRNPHMFRYFGPLIN